ncbi:MAG: AI-2E family transporter [Gallionella sp.]|nr:AI-2E family transporter [Gallionella sp.]
MQQRSSRIGPVTWCGIIGSTCLLIFLFQKILWLVVPFLLALLLYYLLAPFNKKLLKSGMGRDFAAVLLSGAFLLLVIGALLLVYPMVIANAGEWQYTLMRYFEGGSRAIETLVYEIQQNFSFLRHSDISVSVRENMLGFAERFSDKHLSEAILTAVAWLPSILFAPIIAYFLLKDGTQLRTFICETVPNAYFEKSLYLMYALDRSARMYFLGMLKLAAIDAVFLSVGLWLIGVPSPLLLGFIAAILGWIPYIGPIIGCLLAVMVAATDFPGDMSLIYATIGLFGSLRILDDFVFVPYVIGKNMSIHPLLTLLMLFIGEAIAGVAGLMLVIPILGIIMVIGETLEIIFRDTRLKARHTYAQKLHQRAASCDLNIDPHQN